MDMREMVDKVKKGEPLYGHSDLTPYMQGVAARNSRYSALLGHVLPWMNFVNHNQVRCEPLQSGLVVQAGTDLVSSMVLIQPNIISKLSASWKLRGLQKQDHEVTS
jgi:C-terminal of NADH-ubiquinone oxidoreductase 21 kDa subunit